jgi:hypothetical protein
MGQELSESELKQIDKAIDANFESTALPANHLYAARWTLLNIGEERMRLAMQLAAVQETEAEREAEQERVNIETDLYKYRLQHALALCARRLPKVEKNGIHKIKIGGDEFSCALDLLFRKAAEYSEATRIMWPAFSGHSKICHDQESNCYDVTFEPRLGAYGVLDLLLARDQVPPRNPYNALTALFWAGAGNFRGVQYVDRIGAAALGIVERIKNKRNHISYQLVTRLVKAVADEIDYGPTIIPPDWKFPWGSRVELDRFFTGLHARCIYHMVSVHFGAARYKTSTSNQACLWLDRRVLIDDLVRITELAESVVERIVTGLTLGEATKNPDPTLQPFVPVGPGKIAVPSILIVTSRHRRNLLSLHTRVAKKDFDAASHVFEQIMTKDIVDRIGSLVICKPDVWVRGSPEPEQIDLLLADPDKGFILVCELRWMIVPGDPREVYERLEDFAKKLAQAERKLAAVRSALPQVCGILGLDVQRNWSLGAMVIVEGNSGIPSSKPNFIPIVAKEIFIEVLTLTKDLDRTQAVLSSPLWLPREGIEFQREQFEEVEVCGIKFRMGRITLTGTSYLNKSLPRYVAKSAARNPQELRTDSW